MVYNVSGNFNTLPPIPRKLTFFEGVYYAPPEFEEALGEMRCATNPKDAYHWLVKYVDLHMEP